MYFEIGRIFNVASGHLGCVEFVLRENVFVSQAEVFDQVFFAIVGDEADIHVCVLHKKPSLINTFTIIVIIMKKF